MTEKANGLSNTQHVYVKANNPWVAGPKDFIFRYLPYLPLLLISVAFFMVIAYIKVRYTTQIFKVQSSLLIQNDMTTGGSASGGGGSKDEKFEELFMSQDGLNLSNEIQVLRSTPVLQRVAKDLDLQKAYYSKGNVRSSLMYPVTPFTLNLLSKEDSSKGFGFKITLIDANRSSMVSNAP